MALIKKRNLLPLYGSLAVAVVLLIILLSVAGKYRVKLLKNQYSGTNAFVYYTDLDHDGRSEKIDFLKDFGSTGKIAMIVYNSKDQILDQWNFDGQWGKQRKLFIGDIDGDGSDEVILFSLRDDSLRINCVDPLHGRVLVRDRPIAKIYRDKNRYNLTLSPGFFYDYDGDGIKEIYFGVTCGFATRPRRVFAYNLVRDTLISSPYGCVPVYEPRMWDLDRDGSPEIFINSFAPGNCDTAVSPPPPYNDYDDWLEVLTPGLRFKFSPIRFRKYPSSLYAGVIKGKREDYLVVFHHYRGREGYPSVMLLLDGRGKILKKKKVAGARSAAYNLITPPGGEPYVYLVNAGREVFKIDTSLTLVKYAHIPESFESVQFWTLDADGDGTKEFIFKGRTMNEFVIARHDLKHTLTFQVDHAANEPVFSVIRRDNEPPVLVLDGTGAGDLYLLSYGKTFVFRYWFLFFFLFFSFVWLLFYFAGKVREFRRLKVADTQRRIYELQLKAFQNQLDPHFTFNAITSLGTLIYTEKKEEAYDYLVRFSELIRKILESSDKIAHPLEEELDFVRNYLDLQQFRMKGGISYDIQVAPGVNTSERVPRMIIQTHVENALKHGLLHSEKKGHIGIRIACVDHVLTIEVEDNGIGREKARQLNQQSTHLGLKVTEQFYTLINKYNRQKIAREIIDLYDDRGEPAGTRVVLRIPEGIVYEL